MKVEYSRRALADLAKAGRDSQASFGSAVAEAVERRIRGLVARIEGAPGSGRELSARPGGARYPACEVPLQDLLRNHRREDSDPAHPPYFPAAMGRGVI